MTARKTLGTAFVSVATVATMVLGSAPTSAAMPTLGSVTATPNSNLVDNQTVSVSASGFGDATTLYTAECDQRIIATQDSSYCDQTPGHLTVTSGVTGGAATYDFTVHTGANFLATHPGATCDSQHPCYILVSDDPSTPSTVGFTQVTFRDVRAKTRTVLKAKHVVKAGHKVRFKAVTKRPKSAALR